LSIANHPDVGHEIKSITDKIPGEASSINKLADKAYVDNKVGTLEFDKEPKDGSTNPVESNGIFDAIKVVKDDVNNIKDVIPSEASSLNKLVDQEYVDNALDSIDLSNYYSK
jgi:hypothetical protein